MLLKSNNLPKCRPKKMPLGAFAPCAPPPRPLLRQWWLLLFLFIPEVRVRLAPISVVDFFLHSSSSLVPFHCHLHQPSPLPYPLVSTPLIVLLTQSSHLSLSLPLLLSSSLSASSYYYLPVSKHRGIYHGIRWYIFIRGPIGPSHRAITPSHCTIVPNSIHNSDGPSPPSYFSTRRPPPDRFRFFRLCI